MNDRESATRPHEHLHLRLPPIDEDEDMARERIAQEDGANLVQKSLQKDLRRLVGLVAT